MKAAQAGIAKYFPNKKAVLVNSDGGSKDGTMEVVQKAVIQDFSPMLIEQRKDAMSKIVTPYHGDSGKGNAFLTIFEIAKKLNAKACAVVDADLRSITPEWIDLLIGPILHSGYDFVSPYYLRHKFDGTITNTIVYPMTRALYGKRIRQPIGGDFGFSGKMARHYLKQDVWDQDIARFGIDIWMTTTALVGGFKVCQTFLGAKIHDAKEPSTDLSTMLQQVVHSVFALMEAYEDVWQGVKGSEEVPIFGFQYGVGLEPINVKLRTMVNRCRLGVRQFSDIWDGVLTPEGMKALNAACSAENNNFHIDDDLWVRIIYDFAAAYHRKLMNREHLLKSLTPLYLGKVATFVSELKKASAHEVEERLERLCVSFEEQKPYLRKRWKGK